MYDKESHDPMLRAMKGAQRSIERAIVMRREEAGYEPPPVPEPEPVPKPEWPTRPAPATRYKPANMPDVTFTDVTFNGKLVHWRKAENLHDTWISSNNVNVGQLMAHFGPGGRIVVRVLNCIAFTDRRIYAALRIAGQSYGDVVLEPGYCATYVVAHGESVDPGLGTPEGLANAKRWYSSVEELQATRSWVAGTPRANDGGGAGIYDNIAWAAGTQLGLEQALEQQLGWANRNAYWRVDQEEWEQGRVTPWTPGRGTWYGLDRSRNEAPGGWTSAAFGKSCPKVVGKDGQKYDQLDHEHLGRATHMAHWCAQQGYEEALVHLMFLAGDVRLGWTWWNAVDETPSAEKSLYLTAHGIIEHYPSEVGCYWTGRAYGHALWTLAKAVERGLPYEDDLDTMLDLGEHVLDKDRHAIFAIPRRCPLFGHEVTAYDTKLAQYDERIPEGATPMLEVQFESWIILRAMSCAAHLREKGQFELGAKAHHLASELKRGLKNDELRSHLRALGHPDWSDPDGPNWYSWLMGQRTADKVATEQGRLSWMADNAANALPQGWD